MFWRKPTVSAEDKAVLDLKMQRDKIKQYQKRISAVVAREHELSRQCLQRGDRPRALVLLRRKKYQEQLLSKTDAQLSTLEELTSSIEFSQIQKDVLFGLEQGNKVLKELNAQMSLDRVEKIMDDSAEGIEYQQEVSDMLASRITHEDELEIEDELAAMEAAQVRSQKVSQLDPPSRIETPVSAQLPAAPNGPILPQAPTEEPAVPEERQSGASVRQAEAAI